MTFEEWWFNLRNLSMKDQFPFPMSWDSLGDAIKEAWNAALANQWQPISTYKFKEDNTSILAAKDGWFDFSHEIEESRLGKWTHWMPLPEPPK